MTLLLLASLFAVSPAAPDASNSPAAPAALVARVAPAAPVAAAAPAAVTFDTADGGHIAADQYGSGTDAVVLAHGARFNKESWAVQAQALAAQGHMVLAIDFRGYGTSTAGRDGKALFQDVLAAVRYARAHGARSVSVVGASMGGGASGRAAVEARPGEIDRLLLLSPVSIDDPGAMHAGRILYIASRDEPMAPGIREQFARAPQPKRLVMLDGDGHAQNIFPTPQGPELTTLLLDFLK
ncbi:MAG TPA: alpha/beta hydrolase [Vicinamibacterales bacterium]|nr:alpha/beta hydrolase [Vicinamibacterales bacterium]